MKNEQNGYLDPTCYFCIVPKYDIFGFTIEDETNYSVVNSCGIEAPKPITEPTKNN